MSTQKIFFSYSRSDSPFALTLAKDLREAGADIWLDQLDIPAGAHWDATVEKALNTAAYVLVILSPASTASTNVMDEVSFALESGKRIIPVLLEDCLAPFRLRRLQRIDFSVDYTTGFNQLVLSLNLSISTALKNEGSTIEPIQIETLAPDTDPAEIREREKRENNLWEEACKLNTIASYKKYMAESLSGAYKDEAKLLIKQLEVEQKEDELESMLWQKAKTERSKNLYQHYLQQYPQGNYKTLAVAAISEFEKAEKEEQARLRELELAKEKERALLAQQEREKAQALENERALQAKLEREKAQALENERALQAKQEKEKALQLENERALQLKQEKEKALQLEKEKALLAKQEKEKVQQQEKEKAQREKQEKDRVAQVEKEKAQREKQEKDKLAQQEKEKAQREKQLAKEQAQRERKENGGAPAPGANNKKYVLIGAGILVLCLGLWGIIKMSSGNGDHAAWKAALLKNDSTAFAIYLQNFPQGKYSPKAKEKSDSLFWIQQSLRDSLKTVAAAQVFADSILNAPTAKTTTSTKDPLSSAKPKTPPTTKPKTSATDKPVTKFKLGQLHQGGYIFYINPAGDHGYIAYFKDLPSLNWENAQKKCTNFKSEGYEDWRLPTKDELYRLYQNRDHIGIYSKSLFWSSTESNKNSGWAQNFKDGALSSSTKQMTNVVRPIRSF